MNLRLFCRYVCPLGLLQSGIRLGRGPRRVCTRLPESKTQKVVRWTIFALYCLSFFWSGLYLIKPFVDPYSIVCRAVCHTLFSPETDAAIAAVVYLPLLAVLLLALFTKGRFWCNWICPWGTAFHQISKCLSKGDKVGAHCGECKKCFH